MRENEHAHDVAGGWAEPRAEIAPGRQTATESLSVSRPVLPSGLIQRKQEAEAAPDDIYWEDPEELTADLRHDHDVFAARLKDVNRRLAELEKAGYQGEPGAVEREREELGAKKRALVEEIDAIEGDLTALESPATPAEKRNEIYAKRASSVSIDESTDYSPSDYEVGGGWNVTEDGVKRGRTRTSTSLDDGVARTDVNTDTTTIGASGVTSSGTKKTTEVTDWGESSKESKKSTSVTWANPGVSTSETESTSRTGADGKAQSESTTTGVSVNASGVETNMSSSQSDGDTTHEVSKSQKWGRGDGQLGKTEQQGEKTTVKKGDSEATTEATTTKKSSLIAGGDQGLGGATERGGSLGRETKKPETADGGEATTKVGVSGSAGASFTVNVKPVEGSDPPKYRIVTSVSLSGRLGVNADASKTHAGSGAKGSVSASGHAAAAGTATFSHVLTEEEARDYISKCHMSESGSPAAGFREFAIIATAIKNPEAAVEAYNDVKAGVLSDPAAALTMPDGDMVDVEYSLEAGASAGAEGGGGGFKGGGKIGASRGGKRKIRVQRAAGKVIVVIEITDSQGMEVGASASQGVANMGYGHKGDRSEGRILRIELDPNDPQFDHKYRSLVGADSLGQLDAMHDKWGGDHHTVNKESSSDTTTAGAGPLGAKVVDGGGYENTWEVDDEGNLVQNIKGYNDLGGSLSAGPVDWGSSSHEEFSARVGPDGKVTGDIRDSDTADDWDKTLGGLGDKIIEDPLGVLTGATPLKEQSKHTEGTKMYDDDFGSVIAAANDERRWMKALRSPKHMESWIVCGNAIRRAGGDKAKIAEALARFAEESGYGRDDVIREIVRDRESGTGGLMYEFPDGLGHLEAQYDALAFNNPAAAVRQLAIQTTAQRAQELGATKIKEIDDLLAAMKAGHNKFENPAVYAEMMGKLQGRRAELAGVLRNVDKAIADKTAYTDEGSTEESPDSKYDRLLEFCKHQKQSEANLLAELHAHREDGEHGASEVTEGITIANKVRDLFKLYKPAYEQLQQIALDNGIKRGQYWLYKPDSARLDKAMAGQDPGAESTDDGWKDADLQDQRENMVGPFHHEAKAAHEADQRKQAVMAEMAKWTAKVNSARMAASKVCGPWNKRSAEGKPFTEAMKRGHTAGNSLYNAAHADYNNFTMCEKYASEASAVARLAQKAIEAYAQAEAAWVAHHHVFTGE